MIALSANVCNTARLLERMGEAEASHAIERCISRMERSIAGHGGRIVAATNGELLATFDSAEQACQAAIDMQNRVATLPPVSGVKLPIRIGLHCETESGMNKALATPALLTAARVAALAASDQILACAALIEELPRQTNIFSMQQLDTDLIEQDGSSLKLAVIEWRTHDERHMVSTLPEVPEVAGKPAGIGESGSLVVHHRGQTFLIDAKSPCLKIGRDASCQLVIGDRKVSRSHGLVERRNQGYFYVDRSSNGSHVRLAGHDEVAVRQREFELRGSGRIFFGGPAGDPQTEFVDFEIS